MRSLFGLCCALLAACIAVGWPSPAPARLNLVEEQTQIDVDASTVSGGQPGPQTLTVADIDGDHHQDLLVISNDSDGISLFLGDGSGGFGDDQGPFDTDSGPVALAVADVDGDGLADVIVVDHDDSDILVLLQDQDEDPGEVCLDSTTDQDEGVLVDPAPVGIAIGKFDADAFVDLAVLSDSSIHLLQGLGNGDFQDMPSGATIQTGSAGGYSIVSADFNNDGRLDLAVSNQDTSQIQVLFGNGNGTFQPAKSLAAGSAQGSLAIGNFGGDPSTDIAVTAGIYPDTAVSILLSDGAGGFQQVVRTDFVETGGLVPNTIGVDLDGDNKTDLVVTNPDSQPGLNILCQQPSTLCFESNPFPLSNMVVGGFQLQVDPGSFGPPAAAVVAGDLNGDGLPELMTVDPEGEEVTVFLNQTGKSVVSTPTATLGIGVTPTTLPSITAAPTTVLFTPTPLPTNSAIPTATPTAEPTAPYGVCNSLDAGVPFLGEPVAVATGRFNSDAVPDIAVVDAAGNRVVILLSALSNGATPCGVLKLTVASEISLPSFPNPGVSPPYSVVARDFSGDGKVDLVVASPAGVSLLLGDGTGGFQLSSDSPLTAGVLPASIVVADLNGGPLDLLIANIVSSATSGDFSIFLGAGGGMFHVPSCAVSSPGRAPSIVVSDDLNVDGLQDFAAVDPLVGKVSILQQVRQTTTTTTTCPIFDDLDPVTVLGLPTAMVSGQLNNRSDTIPDLVVALVPPPTASPTPGTAPAPTPGSSGDGSIQLLFGSVTPAGNVAYPGVHIVGIPRLLGSRYPSAPSAVGIGDIIVDGSPDIAVADAQNDDVVILRGAGDGTFQEVPNPFLVHEEEPIGTSVPVALAMADMDGDGIVDIITANAGDGSISVLLSSRPRPTPTPTQTGTPTITRSPTISGTPTPAFTFTPAPPATATPTITVSPTPTNSRPPTPTDLPTATATQRGVVTLQGTCSLDQSRPPSADGLVWLVPVAWMMSRRQRNHRRRVCPHRGG